MKLITEKFNVKSSDQINVYFLGDTHEGNVNFAEKELKKAVKIIQNDPKGYWVGMGDFCEYISKEDKKRFNPLSISEKYQIKDLKDLPRAQVRRFFEYINPIQSKCIALISGNHEESCMKHSSNDVFEYLADQFASSTQGAIPPQLIRYNGFIKLNFYYQKSRKRSNRTSIIAVNHGVGGSGKREGYPLNILHDTFRWSEADVNIMAHIHQLKTDTKKVLNVNCGGESKLIKRRKYYGCSGCFLYTYIDGNMNYFEHKGKDESDIGMLKLEIKISSKRPIEYQLNKIVLG